MTITLTSEGFAAGQRIPTRYTGDGDDLSPPLRWSGTPAETKQMALICDDPDAPSDQPWVHWVIYHLPPELTGFSEGVAASPRLEKPAAGILQGRNSWPSGRTIGYRGPAPPPGHGTHHYHFKLYALDQPLDLQPGVDKAALLQAMEGHILVQGELIGTYSR